MRDAIRRVSIVVGWLAVAAAFLYYLGVGGYRFGFLWVALPLVGVTALLAWRVVPDEAPYRGAWALAAAVVGLTVAGVLVDTAPPSAGELASRMDDLELPSFKEISERRSGSSTCRPLCPSVERLYDAPDTAPFAATYTVALALMEKDMLERPPARTTRLRLRGDDMTVAADVRDVRGNIQVLLRYAARR